MTQLANGRATISADEAKGKVALENAHRHIRAAGEMLHLAVQNLTGTDEKLAKRVSRAGEGLAKIEKKAGKKVRRLEETIYGAS